MRKVIVCACAYLIIVASSFKVVSADEIPATNDESKIEHYISGIYSQIDFSKCDKISYEAFDKAYRGYVSLRNAGKLNTDKNIITVCDFNLPSSQNRMWIIDLDNRKVLFNTYVAHGEGSGDDMATQFSNDNNSHQSSLGFYVTAETYTGEHGTSLRLNGMDAGYNDAAYDRGIVVHGAAYVCNKFVCTNQRLGRSWGCPAVPAKLSLPIINAIKGGTCLFIYHADAKYMSNAYWVNKKITYLPESDLFANLEGAAKPRVREIQYVHNGKVDSVKMVAVAQ
jgi:hypothetical protein